MTHPLEHAMRRVEELTVRIDQLEPQLAAIDALHRHLMGGDYCAECDNEWPCRDHRIIHHKETT